MKKRDREQKKRDKAAARQERKEAGSAGGGDVIELSDVDPAAGPPQPR